MILTLHGFRGLPGEAETLLSVSKDRLTVDGTLYDLSAVPDGGQATAEGTDLFAGPIRRIDGVIHAALRVRLGPDAAPDQPAAPWTVTATRGPVTIPALRIQAPEVTGP